MVKVKNNWRQKIAENFSMWTKDRIVSFDVTAGCRSFSDLASAVDQIDIFMGVLKIVLIWQIEFYIAICKRKSLIDVFQTFTKLNY